MSTNDLNHRLKTKTHRNHRSLAALDTSNPDYRSSPIRNNVKNLTRTVCSANVSTFNKPPINKTRISTQTPYNV